MASITETLEKLKQAETLADKNAGIERFFEKGKRYLISTVTLYFWGEIDAVEGTFVVLKDAKWVLGVPDIEKMLSKGEVSSIAASSGSIAVNTNAIVTCVEIDSLKVVK